ncbi:DUF1574 family protein [Pontibacter sp. JH31]|uniref:DUF1574 family protein n=1 Tax=Pontibacter aquaedesilientis TaxID=2766980 RepID=A0ABR7XF67_9BACT|nr:DUF1574 family protein [Pontibacter aquaedesilientis]MBD1396937.1 DUF1574 family protein [Pontibacter aquaedesilientis]
MKKLFIKILAVIITGFLIYSGIVLVFYGIGKVNWLPNIKFVRGGVGDTLLRLREAKEAKGIDLICVGSSIVSRGYDPRVFAMEGIRLLNLGSSSQSPYASYFLLKMYLPSVKPKFVLLDLYWPMLSKIKSTESSIDLVSNSEINSEILEMVWYEKDALVMNTLFVSWITQIITPLNKAKQKTYDKRFYTEGGFSGTKQIYNTLTTDELSSFRKHNFTPAPIQLEYLGKIVQLCKDHNVELILTVTPVTEEFRYSVKNYDEYESFIKQFASKNNLILFNYNSNLDLDLSTERDFLDKNHLSQTGVEKFNEILIKDFIKLNQNKGNTN